MTKRPAQSNRLDEDQVDSEIRRLKAMIGTGPMQRAQVSSNGNHPYVQPKNAASIILVQGKPGQERVVMGRRNKKLKFMPGALVFPGGRVDPADHDVSSCDELEPLTHDKLITNMRGKADSKQARALGVAAIRELAEETGLVIGRKSPALPDHPDWGMFKERGWAPVINPLRLVARAVTPVGSNRRFDTWFFVMRFEDHYHAPSGGFSPSGELEDLQWINPREAMGAGSREITRVILFELMQRLEDDPGLKRTLPVPSYRTIGERFLRKMI